jgi:hypothetical protein
MFRVLGLLLALSQPLAAAGDRYQPFYSAKIEDDVGRHYAVDLNSPAAGGVWGVIANIWIEGAGERLLLFDCKGHMADPFDRFIHPTFIPPRSIMAALAKIVCDEIASRPPQYRDNALGTPGGGPPHR